MARLVWGTFALIVIAHAVGVLSGMYYRLWWLDIPMHLAGGAWVALFFFYLFKERWSIFSSKGSENLIGLFLLALGFVALVGLLWEFYEYLYDVFIAKRHGFMLAQQGVSDTMGDFVNDIMGGVVLSGMYLLPRFSRGVRLEEAPLPESARRMV